MAATGSSLLRTLSLHRQHNDHRSSYIAHSANSVPTSRAADFSGRRQCLFLFASTTLFKAVEFPAAAKDIPLFGIRKKLEKVEEKAEQLIKEGIDTAEKGIETAEKGIETAEKGIVEAEREIGTAGSFGGLTQAGLVAGAEVLGVLIATSVVNGILGPEAKKS